jgi:hypothetical protein
MYFSIGNVGKYYHWLRSDDPRVWFKTREELIAWGTSIHPEDYVVPPELAALGYKVSGCFLSAKGLMSLSVKPGGRIMTVGDMVFPDAKSYVNAIAGGAW